MNAVGSDRVESGSRLASNTASLVTSRLVVAALGWGGTVLIVRSLGTEGFGQFSLVFSLLGMLSIITDLGVGRVAVSAIMAADEEDGAVLAGTYILLRTTLGVMGYAAAMLAVLVLRYPDVVVAATAVGGLVVLFSTPSHAYDVAFQVRNRLHPLAILEVVGQLAQVALTIALVIRGGSIVWFTVPAVLNAAVILAWKVPAAHRLTHFRYRIDLATWRALLREAIPLTAGSAFVTLYYRLDSVMLSKLDGFDAVGAYGVAYKFVDLVHFVGTALTVAVLAPLTAAWTRDREEFGTIVTNAIRILLVTGVGSMIGFWIFAGDLAALLYGSDYRSAADATRIVITAEFFGGFAGLGITVLIAADRHRIYPLITLGGLLVNLVANLILIPRASLEGAAAATLLTEMLVALLLWTRVARLPIRFAERSFVIGVVAAGVTAFAVGLGAVAVLPWIVAAGLCGATYLAVVGWRCAPDEGGWRALVRPGTDP